MAELNKRVLLAGRPHGWVDDSHFQLDEQKIPSPGAGQVLIRNIVLSVDPYMRARMNDVPSYIPPFEVGEVLQGGVVGEVIESDNPQFRNGDYVVGLLGWETWSLSDGNGLAKIDPELAPLSYFLGVLGMPGATAYVGLTHVAECREKEAVLVSAASGAVGSVVVQIAKNMDCYVVGSAGSDDKCDWVTGELGADASINYRTSSVHQRVRELFPDGIDVDFENVGGEMLEAAIWNVADNARIALCGVISDLNQTLDSMPAGPRGIGNLIRHRARMQGFIVTDHPDLMREWVEVGARWLKKGKLKYRESIAEGIENAPAAFIGMLKGENFGKQIVRLDDD